MAYSVDDYYKRLYKTGEKELKDSEKVIRNEADAAIKAQKEAYAKQMSDVQEGYDSALKRNEIQRVLNERYLERKAAEMGLTDSGVNRTQITANQLSYANQKGALDANMQKDINTLAAAMNAKISEIETTRDANISNARNTYSANIRNAAIEARNKDLEYEKKAESKLAKLNYGTLANTAYGANDNVIYTDLDGNQVYMRKGANPYTGTVNSDLLNEDGVYDASKAFGNGYQPKYYNGEELKKYKPSKTSEITSKTPVPWRTDGVEQQVFTTGNDKYYVWYGPENRYVEARFNPFSNEWEINLG